MYMPDNPNLKINYGSALSKIVLAGGCFWGTQAYIRRVPGVAFTQCGYANGHTEDPTYEDVCSGATGHAEAVMVQYDASRLPLSKLLTEFFKTIDPTTLNRQSNDMGSQYRSGIYYMDPHDLPEIQSEIEAEQKKHNKPIVTQVVPLTSFYPAEGYHQDYLEKNPSGYCHVDLRKLEALK